MVLYSFPHCAAQREPVAKLPLAGSHSMLCATLFTIMINQLRVFPSTFPPFPPHTRARARARLHSPYYTPNNSRHFFFFPPPPTPLTDICRTARTWYHVGKLYYIIGRCMCTMHSPRCIRWMHPIPAVPMQPSYFAWRIFLLPFGRVWVRRGNPPHVCPRSPTIIVAKGGNHT